MPRRPGTRGLSSLRGSRDLTFSYISFTFGSGFGWWRAAGPSAKACRRFSVVRVTKVRVRASMPWTRPAWGVPAVRASTQRMVPVAKTPAPPGTV